MFNYLLMMTKSNEGDTPPNPAELKEDSTEKSAQMTQQSIQHGIMLVEINKSVQEANRRFDEIINRVRITFWSILLMNWILIGMGVALFGGAFYSALGGKFEVTAALSATGVADILSVFVFAMNRVQTSLGDQVQIQLASNAYMKQILNFDEHFKFELDTKQIENINSEIRKITLNTMELIQKFTKIGMESSKEPWINPFPIRYEKLDFPHQVYEGTPISVSGVIKNEGDMPVTLTSIVIAVRPPLGTPLGGPFNFDFSVQPGRVVKSRELVPIKAGPKAIEVNISEGKQDIPNEYRDKQWYAYITCQTEDGYWHDDPNKSWFVVHRKNV